MGPLSQTQTQHPNSGPKTQKSKVRLAQSHLNFAPTSQQNNVSHAVASVSSVVSGLTVDQNQSLNLDHDHDHRQECAGETIVPITAEQKEVPNGNRMWSDVVNESKHFMSNAPVMAHKPDVAPVFLNFKQVSREGFKIPLIEAAAAVGKVVRDTNVDGVQPMRSSWQIYVKIDHDHTTLVSRGIQLAGKWISLQALVHEPGFSINAKIILKDLPMNEVSNKEILQAVKQKVDIKSEV